jgi:hypothetical protein
MIEGWVGHRDGMDAVVERKIYCPYWELNPGHPAHCLLLYSWSPPTLKNTELVWGKLLVEAI